MKRKVTFVAVIIGCLITVTTSQAYAVGSGGFENATYSAISLAQGNAVAAQGEEPAAISYNPAAITDLPGVQFQSNTAFISLTTYYDSDSQPSTKSNGALIPVPTSYLTVNPGKILDDRLSFGVGIDAPFGLSTQYDSTHPIVRYTSGANNWLKMFSIKPVAAVKVTDKLSVAAGPVWYRAYSVGTITQYPNFFIVPGSKDGQLRAELSGNRWGWQASAKYKASEKHHFGFYFRGPVNIRTRGYVQVENALQDLAGSTSGTIRMGARAKLSLPMHITTAYAFRPNEKSVIEMDLGWTKWSNFKRIQIHAAENTAVSAVGAINGGHDALLASLLDGQGDYRDTFSLNMGGSYDVTKKLTLRAGGFFYWTPLPKHHFRPNLPDSNSLGLSVGGSYQIFDNLALDLVYSNRFWFTRNVDNPLSETLGTSVDGEYRSYLQQFMISFRYLWDFHKESSSSEEARVEKKMSREDHKIQQALWESTT